jgi:hypothetical protein
VTRPNIGLSNPHILGRLHFTDFKTTSYHRFHHENSKESLQSYYKRLSRSPYTSRTTPFRPSRRAYVVRRTQRFTMTGTELHGSCACGRNRYIVSIPTESDQFAQVFFDNSSSSRTYRLPRPNSFVSAQRMKTTFAVDDRRR